MVTPCTLTITPANGKAETATLKAGDVVWFDAVTHAGHNTGTADCRVVVVELKETK
jgi:quercetin dioxygenase-like cupin family protein